MVRIGALGSKCEKISSRPGAGPSAAALCVGEKEDLTQGGAGKKEGRWEREDAELGNLFVYLMCPTFVCRSNRAQASSRLVLDQ